MNFHILTLFPEMVMGGLNTSIIGRADGQRADLELRRSISAITRRTSTTM